MNSSEQDLFCVVGLGRHARKRIIPALVANNQKIIGVVSSSVTKNESVQFGFVSNNLKEALNFLPLNTFYILCTPPNLHYEQILCILESGKSVIVEKPIFLNLKEALIATELCTKKDLVVAEAYMYKYTKLYSRLISFWELNQSKVKNIYIKFLIPQFSPSTFRDNFPIFETILFDIGCYPLSLLVELMPNPVNSNSISLCIDSNEIEKKIITLLTMVNNLNIFVSIGISDSYENSVVFDMDTNEKVSFSPFFHGLAIDKSIEHEFEGVSNIDCFQDISGFEAMLKTSKNEWKESQQSRFSKIVQVTSILDCLNKQLLDLNP